MVCKKCGYQDPQEKILFEIPLCKICATFAPQEKNQLEVYATEKLDWKTIETFRKFNSSKSENQKQGMKKSAQGGRHQNRPPFGYSINDGNLTPNEDAPKVHRIFVEKSKGASLSTLARKYSFSVNGIKKILNNRTYLGEIKFNEKTYNGNHKAIIDEDLFRLVKNRFEF